MFYLILPHFTHEYRCVLMTGDVWQPLDKESPPQNTQWSIRFENLDEYISIYLVS